MRPLSSSSGRPRGPHLQIVSRQSRSSVPVQQCRQHWHRARRRALLANRLARSRRHLLRVVQDDARLEIWAGVRDEPKVQRGQIYNRAHSFDKGQRLGLALANGHEQIMVAFWFRVQIRQAEQVEQAGREVSIVACSRPVDQERTDGWMDFGAVDPLTTYQPNTPLLSSCKCEIWTIIYQSCRGLDRTLQLLGCHGNRLWFFKYYLYSKMKWHSSAIDTINHFVNS